MHFRIAHLHRQPAPTDRQCAESHQDHGQQDSPCYLKIYIARKQP